MRRPSGLFGLVCRAHPADRRGLPALLRPVQPPRSRTSRRGCRGRRWTTCSAPTSSAGPPLAAHLQHAHRARRRRPSVLGALLLGLVLGVIAGYRGGMLDNALIVVMDSLQAFPAVILALVLLALLGSSLQNVIIVITVAFIPNYARVSRRARARAEEQPVRRGGALARGEPAAARRPFTSSRTSSRRSSSCSRWTSRAPSRSEAGLSFLGLGVQPPTASWGVMLADGFARVEDSPWGVIAPGLALMITTLAFTLLGETLRDVFDPRLSGGAAGGAGDRAAARGRGPRHQLPRTRRRALRALERRLASRSSRARSSASSASRAAASRRSPPR